MKLSGESHFFEENQKNICECFIELTLFYSFVEVVAGNNPRLGVNSEIAEHVVNK